MTSSSSGGPLLCPHPITAPMYCSAGSTHRCEAPRPDQSGTCHCSGAAVLCSALQRLCRAFCSGSTRSHLRFHSSTWCHCATASTRGEVDSGVRETLIFCQDHPYIGKNNAVAQ